MAGDGVNFGLAGLSGFAKGLVEGMKYREELKLKREQMEATADYRDRSLNLQQRRVNVEEERYEKMYGEEGFKERELKIKDQESKLKTKTKKLDTDLDIIQAQTRVGELQARLTKDNNKLSSDIAEMIKQGRGLLTRTTDEKKYDKLMLDLRESSITSPNDTKLTSTINEMTNLGVPANSISQIVDSWTTLEANKKDMQKYVVQWNDLEAKKSSELKDKETRVKGIIDSAPMSLEKKQSDMKFLMSVRPEDKLSMRSAIQLIKTYPPEQQEALAKELQNAINLKSQFSLERPEEEMPLPATPERQKKFQELEKNEEIRGKIFRGEKNREAIKKGIKDAGSALLEGMQEKEKGRFDPQEVIARYRNRG